MVGISRLVVASRLVVRGRRRAHEMDSPGILLSQRASISLAAQATYFALFAPPHAKCAARGFDLLRLDRSGCAAGWLDCIARHGEPGSADAAFPSPSPSCLSVVRSPRA